MSLDPSTQGALEDKYQDICNELYENLEDTFMEYLDEQIQGSMWACRSDEWGMEPQDFMEEAISMLKEIATKQLKGDNYVQ